ncbi:MAG: sulfotransferase [Microcoleaceae cyanobacterium]
MTVSPKTRVIELSKTLKFNQNLGYQFLQNNYLTDAEKVFRHLTFQYPEKPQGYEGLARVAMRSQRWELAIKRWAKVIKLFPDRIPAKVALGNILIELNQLGRAELVFQDLVKHSSDKPQGYEGLARVAQRANQQEQALKHLDTSIANTNAKSSYLGKARLLINLAQNEQAFKLMSSFVNYNPHDLEMILEKAKLLVLTQNFDVAIQEINRLPRADQELLQVKVLLISALIGRQQFNQASLMIESLPDFQDCNHQQVRFLKTWQKYYQQGFDFNQPKIFGIGLSHTGTNLLNEVLNQLGYTSVHLINPITSNVLDSKDFLYFDAFTDISVSFRFEELFFAFPNAQFIYIERDLNHWVKSISQYYTKLYGFSTPKGMRNWLTQSQSNSFKKRRLDYDTTYRHAVANLYAHHLNWKSAYRSFDKRVKQFFDDKPKDKLLKINLVEENNWENICHFLELPIPSYPFPGQRSSTVNPEV